MMLSPFESSIYFYAIKKLKLQILKKMLANLPFLVLRVYRLEKKDLKLSSFIGRNHIGTKHLVKNEGVPGQVVKLNL